MTRALALALLLCGCPGQRASVDAALRAIPAEDRDGNDRELVKLARALPRACSYQAGRLDYSCAALKELRRRLELKRSDTASRTKARTTLGNLLESQEELIRLAAAEGLFFHLREPGVFSSLEAALGRERAATVRATILRQLCWSPNPVDAIARPLLARELPEAVRTEAAGCFARGARAKPETIAALRRSLESDPSPAVRGNACAALGAQRAEAAIPELAAGAEQRGIEHRCASALAAVGSAAAYGALIRIVSATLERGRMPVQHLAALTSFAGQPCFEQPRVEALLARVVAESKLSTLARARAVTELARLGAKAELRKLRASLKGNCASTAEPPQEASKRNWEGTRPVCEVLEREAR